MHKIKDKSARNCKQSIYIGNNIGQLGPKQTTAVYLWIYSAILFAIVICALCHIWKVWTKMKMKMKNQEIIFQRYTIVSSAQNPPI